MWREAVAAIAAAPEVALACHEGPDGDALGSMLALAILLRKAGKPVTASWGEPFLVPKHYAFLPGLDLASPPGDFPHAPDLLVTFDAGSLGRLGSLEASARRARRVAVVDHHASNELFGHINLVDAGAAASAIVIYELAGRLGIAFDRDSATCLWTGLVTDTGSFKYRSATAEVHRIAADLLRFGVTHDEIARTVFDTHPMGYLKLAAVALERAELLGEASVVWTWITQKDLEAHAVDMEDTEGLIDTLRTADAAEVACILKELPDGRYKVSMRSKGGADVGRVAEALGGGGHPFAAGFTTADGDSRAAVSMIVARLSQAPS